MNFKNKIGLGTFPFSGVFSEISQQTAEEITDLFIENDGSYIETAEIYPVKDVILGDILKKYDRDKYFLATKCVTSLDADGNVVRSGKKESIIAQCESEIKRLGVEYLDLLQAHIPPEDVPLSETVETLEVLRSRGLVRFIGVSNVTKNQLKTVLNCGNIDFIQNRFSLIHQKSRDIENLCKENSILLNPYQIIERGQLASVGSVRQADDLRNKKPEYNGDADSFIKLWAQESLKPIADSLDVSIEEIIIAWTVTQPCVGVCPVGTTKKAQLKTIMQGAKLSLSAESLKSINSAYYGLLEDVKSKGFSGVEEFRGL